MPGTIIFRPIEANITLKDKDLAGKMDPYCLFHVGTQNFKSQVCQNGGNHPIWQDSISVPLPDQLGICLVDLKDKDMLIDDKLGSFEVDIREIASLGQIRKWYPIYSKDKPAGEILLEASVSGTGTSFGQSGLSHGYTPGTNLGQGSQFSQSSQYYQGTQYGQGNIGSNLGQPGLSQGYVQGTGTTLGQGSQFSQGGQYYQGSQFVETSSIPVTTSKTYTQPLPPNMYGQGLQPQFQSTNPTGIPMQHQPHVTPPVSLSEQYAMDAVSHGVDPINTQEHFQYNAQQGVMNPGFSGVPMGSNPEGLTYVGTQSSNLTGSHPKKYDDHNLPGYATKNL